MLSPSYIDWMDLYGLNSPIFTKKSWSYHSMIFQKSRPTIHNRGWRGFNTMCIPNKIVRWPRFYSSMKLAIHIRKINDLWVKVIISFLGTFWIKNIINLMLISKAAAKNLLSLTPCHGLFYIFLCNTGQQWILQSSHVIYLSAYHIQHLNSYSERFSIILSLNSLRPALCVYLAIMIHNKIKNLELIETWSKLGLSISKHWLSNLSTSVGNSVIEANERDGVIIPMNLKRDFFSTAFVDNIDVNTKVTLLTTSLHGTAASLNQQTSTLNQGESR